MRNQAWIPFFLIFLAGAMLSSWPSFGFEEEEYQLEYRRILEEYASGDLEPAFDRLMRLEQSAVAGAGDAGFKQIWRVERGVIQDVLTTSPDVLLPIILFYEHALVTYRARDLPELAQHSLAVALALADAYVEGFGNGEGRSTAADLLASLAGYASPPWKSMMLLLRALELDPTHEVALLNVAKMNEVTGDYRQAVKYLRRLIAAHRDYAEGRLRLAINLTRVGKRSEARNAFQEILAGSPPDWIRSLAHQELARMLIDDGDLRSARLQLAEAAEKLPSDPSLAIPLAYLAEREGTVEGGDLAATMRICSGQGVVSARLLYSRIPGPATDELREGLRADAAPGLRLLSRALSLTFDTEE